MHFRKRLHRPRPVVSSPCKVRPSSPCIVPIPIVIMCIRCTKYFRLGQLRYLIFLPFSLLLFLSLFSLPFSSKLSSLHLFLLCTYLLPTKPTYMHICRAALWVFFFFFLFFSHSYLSCEA
ncbi:hypothetical protein F4775DRAFT_304472 [Biscogniauxia sp. FL1348]|nr:hypothetical protein F4775DRAFT_304472 [Biscogniauxia sp. FL1348]